MTQHAFERGDWQTVIDAHPLESHDPAEWLRYGVALLQTLKPGAEEGKQQQQAALAFVQAEKEGAAAEAVSAAKNQAVLLNLKQALNLAAMPIPSGLLKPVEASQNRGEPSLKPNQCLEKLVGELARVFALDLQPESPLLDQVLAIKEQLQQRGVSVATAEQVLRDGVLKDQLLRDEVLTNPAADFEDSLSNLLVTLG
jgi:hypothetical protein